MKIGIGFDVHKFNKEINEKNFVMIGGIKIPYKYMLQAHSDGDVVLHALTDAMLGAIAKGDIGEHFPPTDEKWKGQTSSVFLKYAFNLVQNEGYKVGNIDINLIAENPRILEYKSIIRENIAEILNINISEISLKATTTEKLGFIGRGEGIAAEAIILIIKS